MKNFEMASLRDQMETNDQLVSEIELISSDGRSVTIARKVIKKYPECILNEFYDTEDKFESDYDYDVLVCFKEFVENGKIFINNKNHPLCGKHEYKNKMELQKLLCMMSIEGEINNIIFDKYAEQKEKKERDEIKKKEREQINVENFAEEDYYDEGYDEEDYD